MSHALKRPLAPSTISSLNASLGVLDQKTFESLSQKIYQQAGIVLPYNEKNIALFNNRLSSLMRDFGLKTYQELNEAMRLPSEKLKNAFISSLTTNKTHFFREEAHFDFLKAKIFPLIKSKPELRIWSSACSLGSEAYTVALMAEEIMTAMEKIRLKILATDIDLEVLARAVSAKYSKMELEGLPPHYVTKYFEQVGHHYKLKSETASRVHFSEFNLMDYQYRFQKKFDVIFCRNVLIYFDQNTTDRVVDLLVSNLELKGHLIIGHSESGVIRHPSIVPFGNSIFQKVKP
ncbi:MAG: CheR family methyltransferase [Bdellovibrionales bacterium]